MTDDGNDGYDGDLFTRPTDPDESRDALSSVKIGNDRREAFFRFCLMLEDPEYANTRNVFQFNYLIDCNLSPIRSKSLCRRISDMVERKNNPFPKTLWLLRRTGERFGRCAILTLTDHGILVRENPKIMTGLWGQTKRKPNK